MDAQPRGDPPGLFSYARELATSGPPWSAEACIVIVDH